MSNKQHISLLRLQQIIRDRLSAAMPLPCWVTAEISEIKVNYSGHCYLELIEKGGENAVPKAKASAVIWRSTFGAVSSYFRSETGRELEAGMNVLMKVAVNYHELYGLSLVVSDIDPLYTIGDMERQRQMTIRRLQDEGVFDMNRLLDIPFPAHRIAVISSRNAAGYQDFARELASSGYRFELTLFDSFMQGHAAEDSVVEALERVATDMDRYDVVVVIRGGGSQSDLAAFDSYRMASHLAQFPLPVITGIGHDKDESVADLVAAVALKTPTAVAGWLVDGMAGFEAWLDSTASRIAAMYGDAVAKERDALRQYAWQLSSAFSQLSRSMGNSLVRIIAAITTNQQALLQRQYDRIEGIDTMLGPGIKRLLTLEQRRLETAERIAGARHPDNILALGFAVVRKNGVAVTDTGSLIPGDKDRKSVV